MRTKSKMVYLFLNTFAEILDREPIFSLLVIVLKSLILKAIWIWCRWHYFKYYHLPFESKTSPLFLTKVHVKLILNKFWLESWIVLKFLQYIIISKLNMHMEHGRLYDRDTEFQQLDIILTRNQYTLNLIKNCCCPFSKNGPR